MEDRPTLMLGTAMWGWTIPKESCFSLLDTFYESGFRWIDAATNYPINKQPDDFRKSEQILLEWIKTNGVEDLEVIMKIGSINNMRGPENNLKKSFVLMCLDEYGHLFGKNLKTLMIHWDNRDNKQEISSTLEAFAEGRRKGLRVGLSGIRHPEIYTEMKDILGEDLCIEIKHNLFQSDYLKYKAFHGAKRFITYGINGGGLKLDPALYSAQSSIRARGREATSDHPIIAPLISSLKEENEKETKSEIESLNHCGMIFSFYSPDILGILIGPSRKDQMKDSLQFYKDLQKHDYYPFYQQLVRLKNQYAGQS